MTESPTTSSTRWTRRTITVDWFFGKGHCGIKVAQLALLLVAWVFAILPGGRHGFSARATGTTQTRGGGTTRRGSRCGTRPSRFLGVLLIVIFVLVTSCSSSRTGCRRNACIIARRTTRSGWLSGSTLAEQSCTWRSLGRPHCGEQQAHVQIQPYADIETFELRGLYANVRSRVMPLDPDEQALVDDMKQRELNVKANSAQRTRCCTANGASGWSC